MARRRLSRPYRQGACHRARTVEEMWHGGGRFAHLVVTRHAPSRSRRPERRRRGHRSVWSPRDRPAPPVRGPAHAREAWPAEPCRAVMPPVTRPALRGVRRPWTAGALQIATPGAPLWRRRDRPHAAPTSHIGAVHQQRPTSADREPAGGTGAVRAPSEATSAASALVGLGRSTARDAPEPGAPALATRMRSKLRARREDPQDTRFEERANHGSLRIGGDACLKGPDQGHGL